MSDQNVYTAPRQVDDVRDCCFYHTVDLPGHGLIQGQWDLRKGIREYLGRVPFAGKRVLDVGAASGFLTFYMESQGAQVVSCDLAPEHQWDTVPFVGDDLTGYITERQEIIRRLNNGYWLCHQAFASRARMVHATIYAIPPEIGRVDIAVCGSILTHVRDPFLALRSVLRFATESVIVTDVIPRRQLALRWLGRFSKPQMTFVPNARARAPKDTWWILRPDLIRRFIAVLGFEDATVNWHWQPYEGHKRLLYTVVGRRTREQRFP